MTHCSMRSLNGIEIGMPRASAIRKLEASPTANTWRYEIQTKMLAFEMALLTVITKGRPKLKMWSNGTVTATTRAMMLATMYATSLMFSTPSDSTMRFSKTMLKKSVQLFLKMKEKANRNPKHWKILKMLGSKSWSVMPSWSMLENCACSYPTWRT